MFSVSLQVTQYSYAAHLKKKMLLTVHQGLCLFLLHLEFVPCFIWCNRTIPLNVYWYVLLNQTGILSQSKLVKSHQHWNVSSTWTVPQTLSLVSLGQVSCRKGISEWQQTFSGGLFTFPQHSDTFLPFFIFLFHLTFRQLSPIHIPAYFLSPVMAFSKWYLGLMNYQSFDILPNISQL